MNVRDKFAHVRDGDIIRVEYEGDGAVEGVWRKRTDDPDGSHDTFIGFVNFRSSSNQRTIYSHHAISRVVVLKVGLPPEPPIGSVVLVTYAGGMTAAFERMSGRWWSASGARITWDAMNSSTGARTIEVIYRAPEAGA